jgi:WD40 repeat protein
MNSRYFSLTLLITYCLLSSPSFAHERGYPDIIPVPNGFQPEGVAVGRGHKAYVGSMLNGAIYQTDLLSGEGNILIEGQPGKMAVGLAYDKRSKYLYVAGGLNGTISVYDVRHGTLIAEFKTGIDGGLINDGIVTKRAAYFTDSFQSVLYKISLAKDGHIRDTSQIETMTLSGDLQYAAGQINANGIVASEDGLRLFIVSSNTGSLYQVDPSTGVSIEVSLQGGDLLNGDGMVLNGKTLYVVQNTNNQVAVVNLSEDGFSGTITNIITNPNYRIPTTAAIFGDGLYVINARFDVAPPPVPGNPAADPSTEFNLIRVEIDE